MLEQILDSVGPLDIIQYFQQTKNVMVLLLWRASLSQAQVSEKEGRVVVGKSRVFEVIQHSRSFCCHSHKLAPKDIRRPKREQSTATSWSESIDI